MANQKLLLISTTSPSIRSKAQGWSAEDGDLIVLHKEIGLSPDMKTWLPPTPMHAIGAGWRLMGPATEETVEVIDGEPFKLYIWWFEK